jgi:hypothetical protein
MIKITSFYPFSNLLTVSQIFSEDHATVTIRSLTSERNFEFAYTEVAKIHHTSEASSNQISFGFVMMGFPLAFFLITFFLSEENVLRSSSILLLIQFLYIIAFLILITGFVKQDFYYFKDNNNATITYIKSTKKNNDKVKDVVKFILNKSPSCQEVNVTSPFPEDRCVFEVIEFDPAYYFSKSITRFYSEKLIVFHKSLIHKIVVLANYNEFNGEVFRGKESNESWDIAYYLLLILALTVSGAIVFPNLIPAKIIAYTLIFIGLLSVVSLLMKYSKREIVGLYDKNGKILYWTWVNKANRDRIEEIMEFVKSKIPAETTAEEQ